jgi:transmembrane sensor
MPTNQQSRQRLFEHALLLIVRQHGAAPDTASLAARELAIWRSCDAAHESACLAALEAWQQTDASALRDEFSLPPSATSQKRQTRRRLIALLGFGGVALASGGIGRRFWSQPSFTLLARTGKAEIEAHELPDGSRIDLAARSELAITYYRNRRLANLVAGEVCFDVAPDARRPFEIETRHGRVRVLGTAFSVSLLEDGLHVAVARGRVAVWRGGQSPNSAPDTELGSGDAVFISTTGELRSSRVVPEDIGAWRQGWLVFEGIPLDKVVDRWNDYLAKPLEMERRPGLANMRLTGSFPIDNPLAFLKALPRTHPVEVIAHGNGRFLIRQRLSASRDEK